MSAIKLISCRFPLAALIIFIAARTSIPAYCDALENQAHADSANCQLYLQLEERYDCSRQGDTYLTLYGHKYCSRFLRERSHWKDARLNDWTVKTSQCLQDSLIARHPFVCSGLSDFAFATHTNCYLKCRFCYLTPKAQSQVGFIVLDLDLLRVPKPFLTGFIKVMQVCHPQAVAESITLLYLAQIPRQLNNGDSDNLKQIYAIAPEEPSDREAFFALANALLIYQSDERQVVSAMGTKLPESVTMEVRSLPHTQKGVANVFSRVVAEYDRTLSTTQIKTFTSNPSSERIKQTLEILRANLGS